MSADGPRRTVWVTPEVEGSAPVKPTTQTLFTPTTSVGAAASSPRCRPSRTSHTPDRLPASVPDSAWSCAVGTTGAGVLVPGKNWTR